ncbi:ATP-binding cassette domain-containing protein [Spirosoma sp. KCTC 42546]|uniref:ATP-binding cassette domain-containing protein n=1 Tax=Spirosoma sp. KCTC 42546 TaxID=2520506 RepID=UPI00115941ED|nr:ATP-binding cassette domain-containing protein [Spirosoma sp. KCTC 42546]QDK83113.1 ATP-binding cassette domain-containing protein [Spirosoma sp. KCTC 42546]
MVEQTSLISLNKLTVQRNGRALVRELSFQLNSNECWAVIGPTGSGKTTFLQALAGQFHAGPAVLSRRVSTEFVSFKEESSRFSYNGYFYQQRYQATMSDSPEGSDPAYKSIPTLRTFLQLTDSSESLALIERLGLTPLLDRAFIKLSNGQTRKARIGKALLKHPSVLLLDNPFVGLDAAFRTELTGWLGELTKHGLTLVVVTEPDDIPSFITHIAEMENGQIRWAGSKENYRPGDPIWPEITLPVLKTIAQVADFEEAFQLRDVTVRYGDTVILNGINWAVRAGERWALFGPNGAGKSVLLSLLYGDHPQAYANDVSVFGHRRGKSGESIWDVKRRIGFVSPELHLYFPQGLSARQVALTGLTDTLTPPNRISPETEEDLWNLLSYFELTHLINCSFGTLSAGEQRLVLLVRAFLKNAPVLLLDEPFQAIDSFHIHLARHLIDSFQNKTILFVTHNQRELPDRIDKLFSI